jgi:hypothetical protein
MGRYHTKYTYRAAWTFFGVGRNLIEDAFYPISLADGDGKPYEGTNKYILRFSKDQLPPVNAFWSITMYDKDSYLVANPINRYALGDRSNLRFADDGSLTISIRSDTPSDETAANWLPSPKEGGFKLALRLYAPKKEVADGSWVPPAGHAAGSRAVALRFRLRDSSLGTAFARSTDNSSPSVSSSPPQIL